MSSIMLAVCWSITPFLLTQVDPVNMGETGYLAEVSGDDVYVRSGPGVNYYPVAKINAGVRVRVFGDSDGWSAVEPPAGCFSLIHKNFVDMSAGGAEGVVNGNQVLVRAGSDISPQLYTKQRKLNRGAVVKVLQPHNEDYLRISPPAGVRVYISSQFVQRVKEVVGRGDSGISSIGGNPQALSGKVVESTNPRSDSASDAAGTVAPNSASDSLSLPDHPIAVSAEEMIQEEEQKPLLERDYGRVIARLKGGKALQEAAVADSYTKARLAQLSEAASIVSLVQEVRGLGEEMATERKAAQMQREKMRPTSPAIGGGFDAIGELRLSMIYASDAFPNRYRLVGEDGTRTVGYVEIPQDSKIDVDRFVGRRVGVRARDMHLQAEDVDPLLIYTASELVLLDGRTDE